ncbi:hypothetical protein JRO89_XS03G0139100 [Xanthoceras sorbifolium]|uniref:PPIase cyclophilin-type domain-containing protein n=1 Tax=Xanthoceras sorbifolium TaxID=99658 RepID=A0ABQ8I9T5_9ROSI|nr:hypothetical protein JRO89_XS03G0139100 [Xanthoceras sorbifolium]
MIRPLISQMTNLGTRKQLILIPRAQATIQTLLNHIITVGIYQTSDRNVSKPKSLAILSTDTTTTNHPSTRPKFPIFPISICGNSSLLLLWGTQALEPFNLHFLISQINGKPVGRIVIGLYGDSAPVGAARFSSLASGTAGISYRRKEFSKIMPNYVRHSGCPGPKNLAGTVSIIIRHPSKPSPKLKLVARKGKLEIDQEEVGKDPNGREFVIATKDLPELDASALVVGRVLEGWRLQKRVAKIVGDKRAAVAERGFNRTALIRSWSSQTVA